MWAQQEENKRNEWLTHKMSLMEFKNILLVKELDTMEYLLHESINKEAVNRKNWPIVIETRAAAVSLREQGVGEKNPD